MRRFSLRKPEDWGVDPVPAAKRNLRSVDLAVLWFNLGVGLLVLYAGTFLSGLGFGLAPLVVIVLSGSIVGSVLLAGAGTLGARHGVPTMVSLRPIFGKRGSYVPTVLNAAQLFGWTFLEIWVMSVAASALSGPFLGSATGVFWVLAFGAFCGLLAWGGPLVVVKDWLERIGVWLVLLSAGWITYVLLTSPPSTSVPLWGGDWTKAGLALDLVVAMPISWWPLVADYNRFAESPRKAFLGTTTGYVTANAWFYLLGAVMALDVADASDVFAKAIVGVFGAWVLLFILTDETDNGFANIYSTSVSIQNVVPRARLRRLVPTITAAGIAAAAALTAFPRASVLIYEPFLYLIGGVFVPMLGVVLADTLVVRREAYTSAEVLRGSRRTSAPAFLAWGLGMLTYFPIYLVNTGYLNLDLGGINLIGASLPAFGVAAVVHILASRLLVPSGEHAPA